MNLSYPVKRFIEDNIVLIEEEEYSLFFYLSMFALNTEYSKELVYVFKDILSIDPEPHLIRAIVDWCKDCVALQHRNKVSVTKLLEKIPHFDYDKITFRKMFTAAVETAYPNKTCLPDSYGIEYVVEKI